MRDGSDYKRDWRKTSSILGPEIVEEMKSEAVRQGRSISYMVQLAWELAKAELRAMPAALVPGLKSGRKMRHE